MNAANPEATENIRGGSARGVILVIGAADLIGRQVVSQLLDSGADVRALAADPESVGLPEGVDVVRGDLSEPGTIEASLVGVEVVFLDWPYDRRAARFPAAKSAPAIVDAVARHARRIVLISSHGGLDDLEAGPAGGLYAELERLIERSGLEWTFLRLCMPASITLNWAPPIRAGDLVRGPYAGSARTLLHERDIAAVAVRALTGDGHVGAKYLLTGPESLTYAEQVRTIGEVIGRPLRYEEITREAAREQLFKSWTPEFADAVLDAMAARVAKPEGVRRTVEAVTGTPARTFREWVTDHADDFR
jgi:uncharacterized protein YbjT (DUF2867 family)